MRLWKKCSQHLKARIMLDKFFFMHSFFDWKNSCLVYRGEGGEFLQ